MHRKPTFLSEVALSLYRRHREDFSRLAVLFPSRRARLYFAEELREVAEVPLWEPEWLSVDRLMEQLSGLHVGDRLRLVVELFRIYRHYHPEEEFDRFYFWGEMLLSDFDMIDKYRVDAESLFRNITELKELDADLSYLTPEQRELISHFWQGVLNLRSDKHEREVFLRIWRSLWPIYRDFRQRQLELGFAYTGLVQRVAAERLELGVASVDTSRCYVVAGFNALTACERVLFDHLKGMGAEFYWDYDESYLKDANQEAGMFMRENLRRYPEVQGEITHNNAQKDKKIEIISAASDILQCKMVNQLLKRSRRRDEAGRAYPLDRRTAIVLTDEHLLTPLLHSVTSDEELITAENVNVTMGFPMKSTLAYTLIERLVALQAHGRQSEQGYAFYHLDVQGILSHPYLEVVSGSVIDDLKREIDENKLVTIPASRFEVDPLLAKIFRQTSDWRELAAYLTEVLGALGEATETMLNLVEQTEIQGGEMSRRVTYLMLLCQEISKLYNSVLMCDIDVLTSTFTSLLRRHLQTLRIPYSGEPLNGVQVMGILETRNLDFERVILLSLTDDNFPGRLDSQASYIPYNLRAAYGLPTPEHHEGVHAYYFYRLLQRADEVVLSYCSHADKSTTGEPSRYIRQLEYESPYALQFSEVGIDVNLPQQEEIVVEKEGEVRERLEAYLRAEKPLSLSPTALSKYISCPLKFYFRSIAHIKPKKEISEEVDDPLFGNILHRAMEILYAPYIGTVMSRELLEHLFQEREVSQAVRRAIALELFQGKEVAPENYSGDLILVRGIIERYIREGILPYEIRHAGFVVRGVELEVESPFAIDSERRILFSGKADRVDTLSNGMVRVVDYKTGGVHSEFSGLDGLFISENRSSYSNIFQTLLYALMLDQESKGDSREIVPELYYVRKLNDPDFIPRLYCKENKIREEVTYQPFKEPFTERLRGLLSELFDYSIPFKAAPDCTGKEYHSTCSYCDYRSICRK